MKIFTLNKPMASLSTCHLDHVTLDGSPVNNQLCLYKVVSVGVSQTQKFSSSTESGTTVRIQIL